MKRVELLPVNARMKQLRKEFGPIWEATSSPLPKQCFNNEMGIGISSLDGKHFRNVKLTDIKDV